MKKLLLIISIFACCNIQAQDSTKPSGKLTVKQVYEDAKTGFKDAFSALKETASKLEGPAKHVYTIYTKQHRVEGVTIILFVLLLCIIPCGIFISNMLGSKSLDNGKSGDNWCMNGRGFVVTMIGLMAIAGIIYTFINLAEGVQKLINPEYYAIQDIIKAFK